MDSIIERSLPDPPGDYVTAKEVRDISGLSEESDIGDEELESLALGATLQMIDDVTVSIDSAEVEVDDNNRIFLPKGLIADTNANAQVDSDDVTVHYVDMDTGEDDDPGLVTVVSAKMGILEVQNAPPDGYTVLVDYAHYNRPLPFHRAKRAVSFLVAHIVFQRAKGPGKITRADLTGIGRTEDEQVRKFVTKHRTKYLDMYFREIGAITGVTIL